MCRRVRSIPSLHIFSVLHIFFVCASSHAQRDRYTVHSRRLPAAGPRVLDSSISMLCLCFLGVLCVPLGAFCLCASFRASPHALSASMHASVNALASFLAFILCCPLRYHPRGPRSRVATLRRVRSPRRRGGGPISLSSTLLQGPAVP